MEQNISHINNVMLWHLVQGKGIPIVLIHGGPGAYDYLEPLGKLINAEIFQIIRYEQRGSWRSEKKGPYNIETFIEDLEQLRIHLGINSWVVCGHSWGASLALAYSAKYPSKVKALIYISGTGVNNAWHAEYRENRLNYMDEKDREEFLYLRKIIDTLKGDEKVYTQKRLRELSLRTDLFDQANYVKLPRVDYPFVNNEVNQQISSETPNYLESREFITGISNIHFPSLFIHGETDPRPGKYSLQLSSSLSNSTFSLIAKSGHYPWLDNPIILEKRLNDFLLSL